MKQGFLCLLLCLLFTACKNEKDNSGTTQTEPVATTPPPAEFADAKYVQSGKDGLAKLVSGDIDGWSASWADNIVWVRNNGDSIAGKEALLKYWKDRRGNAIDSLAFSNEVWLPVKVNQSQGTEATGVWLLAWYKVYARYKPGGKSMTQWMHMDYHYDANDKVDRIIQYQDSAPIAAAMK